MDGRTPRMLAAFLLAAALVVGAVPAIGETPAANPERREAVLEGLDAILERLGTELERLQEADLPALEEQLEGIVELLGALADELDTPSDDDGPTLRHQTVKLDLMLHRFVAILERLVEPKPARPRPGAKEVIDDLRNWVDGYVDAATAGMDRGEARRFEALARRMVSGIGERIGDAVRKAGGDEPEKTHLERALERIEALLARLDRLTVRTFGRPPAGRP